ncbi:acetyl-CoA carboxylase carboxyltransferase subunit alpha/beta [Nocardia asteroides]|uniref:acetyl-CoA carboxylase carboxyltransferase subunit alpha/beta n=1 Tax=Nocardia asteroides TaxID=1824 RepID=UPI001E5A99F2|nr:acetyl-CoA carboxylase carboxyltransferase subunit alpha/beta [Nocardia asteroides]UGT59831.1 acetyl-CoA carboxylase carboxyltransferase subunit alpha/beta [Nocardia asteroides]
MGTSARELIDRLLDPGTFASWDRPPVPVAESRSYRTELAKAAAAAGTDESVLTGEGLLRGRRVAVIACEFGFLAGSIGVAAAERITAAIERATALGLPLVASPTSGGTRMQEGTVAFVQMVKIAGAVAAHKAAGHPYLVYLRNPTMGGVFASWGSLGHMTFAEPGALIGFLGPRVYEALYGEPFPDGVQTAENLYRRGVIDGVVGLTVFRRIAYRALSVLSGAVVPDPATGRADRFVPTLGAAESTAPAWESVLISRKPDRPGLRDLLRHVTHRVPLSGTGQGEHDRTVVHALARFRGRPCIVFGHDRAGHGTDAMGPAALREARRSMALARELKLPLVLVIDTAGAALSKEAEERGLAPEIARCIADLVTLPTPTLSVLLGQGAGGGALALLPADRVLAATHAWLAPLPPEGASAIVHRDTGRAPELAAAQRIGAAELLADGVVDRIVPELPDAAAEPVAFARRTVAVIADELAGLAAGPGGDRAPARYRRYRRLGLPG